jgi:hypothetical protein
MTEGVCLNDEKNAQISPSTNDQATRSAECRLHLVSAL